MVTAIVGMVTVIGGSVTGIVGTVIGIVGIVIGIVGIDGIAGIVNGFVASFTILTCNCIISFSSNETKTHGLFKFVDEIVDGFSCLKRKQRLHKF